MPAAAMIGAGAAAGLAGGFFGSRNKVGGQDSGNPFVTNDEDRLRALNATQDLLKYQGSQDALNGVQGSQTATKEIQNNPILGQLFGGQGTLARTTQEEQNLASRGFSLKPEDYEAYGQASGNVARMFGESDKGLAEALASRGLSSSGAANRGFITSQGNKMEQLAGLQRKIADDRMKSNMERLGQTRNFLSNLGQQGAQNIEQQYGRQLSGEQQAFNEQQGKARAGMALISGQANQGNENFAQQRQTEHLPGWAMMGGGAAAGAASALQNSKGSGGGGALK